MSEWCTWEGSKRQECLACEGAQPGKEEEVAKLKADSAPAQRGACGLVLQSRARALALQGWVFQVCVLRTTLHVCECMCEQVCMHVYASLRSCVISMNMYVGIHQVYASSAKYMHMPG